MQKFKEEIFIEFIKKHTKGIIVTACLLLTMAILAMATLTFARYTTSDNVSKQATVAKWGYVVTVNSDNLFGTKYGNPQDNYVTVEAEGTSIVSSGSSNVIAPGSKGSMTIQITGQAEVLSSLTFSLSGDSADVVLTKTGDESNKYRPIKWTLNDGSNDLVKDATLEELKTALEGQSNTSIAANTEVNKSYTLSWAWALEGNNEYDTYLGKIANDGTIEGYTANTTLKLGLTVALQQIQA